MIPPDEVEYFIFCLVAVTVIFGGGLSLCLIYGIYLLILIIIGKLK